MPGTDAPQKDTEHDNNASGPESVDAILGEQPPDELLESIVAVLDNLTPPKKSQGRNS